MAKLQNKCSEVESAIARMKWEIKNSAECEGFAFPIRMGSYTQEDADKEIERLNALPDSHFPVRFEKNDGSGLVFLLLGIWYISGIKWIAMAFLRLSTVTIRTVFSGC